MVDLNSLNGDFCPSRPNGFSNSIISILNKYLLDPMNQYKKNNHGNLFCLSGVYEDMKKCVDTNPSCLNLYFVNTNQTLCPNNSMLNDNSGNLYAGIDLPVWINEPSFKDNELRMMVVGQDPRRSYQEMQGMTSCISLSSPFGLHSLFWRSKKGEGMIHRIFIRLINKYEKKDRIKVCVYFTDFYKFRKADGLNGKDSNVDKLNEDYYRGVFENEMKVFKPNIIIPVGIEASKSVMNKKINASCCFQLYGNYFPILHVSGANAKSISEAMENYNKNAEEKIIEREDFFFIQIDNTLKNVINQ